MTICSVKKNGGGGNKKEGKEGPSRERKEVGLLRRRVVGRPKTAEIVRIVSLDNGLCKQRLVERGKGGGGMTRSGRDASWRLERTVAIVSVSGHASGLRKGEEKKGGSS